ncbi:hypothetical protein EVAR_4988_1 [Eumeta japonica]|uniref:Uncharacterized protein n=1 Tax=Eumeta variegata TaxID=151549 RepID=A0A4C1UZU5_EUMVA|nr:hypothetical protein EVAR_4988_1 [Eumeta japonica]
MRYASRSRCIGAYRVHYRRMRAASGARGRRRAGCACAALSGLQALQAGPPPPAPIYTGGRIRHSAIRPSGECSVQCARLRAAESSGRARRLRGGDAPTATATRQCRPGRAVDITRSPHLTPARHRSRPHRCLRTFIRRLKGECDYFAKY